MARTYQQIKLEMTTSFMANEVLASEYGFVAGSDFDSEFSKVSLENFQFSIVAYSFFLLEQLFDTHYTEVKELIKNDKAHTQSWYRTKALAFQYGFNLIQDTDQYDNTGYTDEQIANSKVIKYSAVTKSGGQILIKIATETAGVLSPIEPSVKEAFDAYIDEIADAGVKYIVLNNPPDILKLWIKIYRNPLVLDAAGMHIINGNYPVQEAIEEYLKNLPFNGQLVIEHLRDALQKVEGVEIPDIYNATSASIKTIDPEEYNDAQYIDVKIIPVAGYFKLENFDNITYVV